MYPPHPASSLEMTCVGAPRLRGEARALQHVPLSRAEGHRGLLSPFYRQGDHAVAPPKPGSVRIADEETYVLKNQPKPLACSLGLPRLHSELSGDVCGDAQFGHNRVRPRILLAGPETVLGAELTRTIS